MSELQIGFALFVATFLVLFSGIPIGFGLVLISIVFLLIFGDAGALSSVSSIFIGELSSFALLTIPLFVLLGCTIGASRAGKDLYEALHRWLVRVPGGLVIANIMGCGLFAAMCGSSPATAAAIGKIGIPEMIERQVPARLATGSIAAGGTLGILIPPSLTLIVYGIVTHTSIARLFLAGVVPGIFLVVLFALYAWLSSVRFDRRRPGGGSVPETYTLGQKLRGSVRSLPFLAIIVAVTVLRSRAMTCCRSSRSCGHAQLVAVDLGLDLDLGLLHGGDELRHGLLDALADGDLLAGAAQVFQRLGLVHAAHVDAARRQASAQDVGHLLELEGAGRRLGDDVAFQLETRIRALEVETGGEFAVGLVDGVGQFVLVDFGDNVKAGHGEGSWKKRAISRL
ncbi:hypothetical protein CDEN61S_03062 [Castellaniella denitrificans]